MNYSNQLESILKKEVSRGQFIKYIAIAIVGAMGITSFLRNLHKSVSPSSSSKTTVHNAAGYGKSPYGA